MKERIQISDLKRDHLTWRDNNFRHKKGFFPVFSGFKEYMKDLSPGATSLFIYFGMHANNLTGECTHSLARIANYFNKSVRTISIWIKELEEIGLIIRIQSTFNGNAHTYILPYDPPRPYSSKTDNNELSPDDFPF